MRVVRIILAVLITSGVGLFILALQGTSQPAGGQPRAQMPAVAVEYPGLLGSIDETIQRWNDLMPHRPMRYERTFHADEDPEAVRWLDLWVLSRLYCEPDDDGVSYQAGTFSTETIGKLPPRAYVVAKIGGRESVVLFTRVNPASPLPSDSQHGWNRGTLCPLDVALELGSALALIEDFMQTAAADRELSLFCESLRGRWGQDLPVSWRMLQQIDQDRIASGLFQMESDLNVHDAAHFSLWVDTASGRRTGLDLALVRQPGREGYLGWRIRAVRKVRRPEPPQAGF